MGEFTARRSCHHFKGFAKGKVSKKIELNQSYLVPCLDLSTLHAQDVAAKTQDAISITCPVSKQEF